MLKSLIYDYDRGLKRKQWVETILFEKSRKRRLVYDEVKGEPLACLVAGIDSSSMKIYIGISACNRKGSPVQKIKADFFEKRVGKKGAIERMLLTEDAVKEYFETLPPRIIPALKSFVVRCKTYYQEGFLAYDYVAIMLAAQAKRAERYNASLNLCSSEEVAAVDLVVDQEDSSKKVEGCNGNDCDNCGCDK